MKINERGSLGLLKMLELEMFSCYDWDLYIYIYIDIDRVSTSQLYSFFLKINI